MKNKLMSSAFRLLGFCLLLSFVVTASIEMQDAYAQADTPPDDQTTQEPESNSVSTENPSESETIAATPEGSEEPDAAPDPPAKPPAAEPAVTKKMDTDVHASPVPYSKDGADTCLKCHDEDSEFPVLSIFKTKHARSSDQRTPFADLQCESCHGPGGEHSKRVRRGEVRPPITNFGQEATTSVIDQNTICLNCHQDYSRAGWQGSVHEQNDVACASCHTVHAHRDPVSIVSEQPQVCFECHKKERADIYKASVHPVRHGKMACTDCHDAHASDSYASLIRPTLNETCYTCHAEKRGPFLWEHEPAAEDCSLCHKSHGSNHTPLLTKRAPLLCQECHSRFGHPSVQRTADGLPGNRPSSHLLSGSCMNCHSQVHGSNHPSGADFSR